EGGQAGLLLPLDPPRGWGRGIRLPGAGGLRRGVERSPPRGGPEPGPARERHPGRGLGFGCAARGDIRPRVMRAPPAWLAIGLLGIAAGLAYLPDLGHGFIKDDFGWIVGARVEHPGDLGSIFRQPVGFYRPLVTLTFTADRALFGLRPFPYGCTNLALLLLAAGLLVRLGARLGLSGGLAILVGALWTFNFHGVNMAVM